MVQIATEFGRMHADLGNMAKGSRMALCTSRDVHIDRENMLEVLHSKLAKCKEGRLRKWPF